MPLSEGDAIAVTLRADLVDDDYVWRWTTRVTASSGGNRVKTSFRQSTFYGTPLSLDMLKRREAGYVPQPTDKGDVDRYILALVDGKTSLGDIASDLTKRFPWLFTRRQDALTRAADLAEEYFPGS